MIVFLLLVTLLSQRAGALPISADAPTIPTIAHDVVFGVFVRTSCSDVRSTYTIVRSCLLTITACVYRAIHRNIPNPNASFGDKLRVTIKITIHALIVPEMIIWWALRQRFGADIVVNEVNEIKPDLKWTRIHGHFAQMGGFGRKDNKRILYPPTLIRLLKEGQIDVDELRLREKQINSKSRGDILSKALIAFQTTWFVVQCIARLQQGLPIIELEVVTLAFATLNAITYGLWWNKPLNVMRPVYIRIRPTNCELPPLERPSCVELEEKPLLGGEQGSKSGQVVIAARDKDNGVVGKVKRDIRSEGWSWTLRNWLIVKPFLAVVGPLHELFGDDKVYYQKTSISPFYAMKIPEKKFETVFFASSLIGLIFGGVHFLSWTSTFPTRVLLLLWRTSSVLMVAQPLFMLLGRLCGFVLGRASSRSWRFVIANAFGSFFSYLAAGALIPYMVARFCVLVLAFLTLRDLPLGTFTNVSWTGYIPHL